MERWLFRLNEQISIHALREEGDPGALLIFNQFSAFLSTPSARRATAQAASNCLA